MAAAMGPRNIGSKVSYINKVFQGPKIWVLGKIPTFNFGSFDAVYA